MPTPTYDLIEEQVLSSSAASVTFSSIPSTYRDLVVEVIGTLTALASAPYVRLGNGSVDTGSNYSTTVVDGTPVNTTESTRASNNTFMYCSPGEMSNTTPTTSFIYIMSYANTNVFKTVLNRANATTDRIRAGVNLWRSTSAVNIVYLYPSANSFASGSTFRLWGVSG